MAEGGERQRQRVCRLKRETGRKTETVLVPEYLLRTISEAEKNRQQCEGKQEVTAVSIKGEHES